LDILFVVRQEAQDGNKDCQKLLSYRWKTKRDALKGTLILYIAWRFGKEMPNGFRTSANEIIELTESGKCDGALWQLYPKCMEAIYYLNPD